MVGRPKRSRHSRLSSLTPNELSHASDPSADRRWIVSNRLRPSVLDAGIQRVGLSESLRSTGKHRSIQTLPELSLEDTDRTDDRSDDEMTDALYRHLRGGRTSKANGVVQLLLLAGRSVAQVIDGSYQMALTRLGEDWNGYDTGAASWEHRAIEICIRILRQLPSATRGSDPSLTAVGAALADDPYILPVMSAATMLEAEGFDVTNLGPETRTDVLVKTIQDLRPSLVFLSLTAIRSRDQTRDDVAEILKAADSVGARMIVGGQQSHQLRPHDHPGLVFGTSMVELAAFASELAGQE